MNKIVIVLLTIFVLLSGYLFIKNRSLASELDDAIEENKTTTLYIQELTEKLKTKTQVNEVKEDKEEELNSLLNKFLKEREKEQPKLDIKIDSSELRKELKQFEKQQRFIPDLVPIPDQYKISQGFKSKHKALDFAAPSGAEIRAAASGVVFSIENDEYFGNVILINHLNDYITMYAHLAKVLVNKQYFVEKGDVIGLVGNTGNSSSPHLHFEIAYKNERIDPDTLLFNK